jgi:hypothetical protein
MKKRPAVRKSHTPRLPPERPHHAVLVVEEHKQHPDDDVTVLGATWVENEATADDLALENHGGERAADIAILNERPRHLEAPSGTGLRSPRRR